MLVLKFCFLNVKWVLCFVLLKDFGRFCGVSLSSFVCFSIFGMVELAWLDIVNWEVFCFWKLGIWFICGLFFSHLFDSSELLLLLDVLVVTVTVTWACMHSGRERDGERGLTVAFFWWPEKDTGQKFASSKWCMNKNQDFAHFYESPIRIFMGFFSLMII